MVGALGDRALVLGGSLTGLFAASVLAQAYEEVVLVDRDELIGVREARRGAPQARHINGLLARGQLALEDLFPGIGVEIVRGAMAPMTDLSGTVRWYIGGKVLKQERAGLACVGATRPILEAFVRDRVQAMPNVRFIERCDIVDLLTTDGGERVTGARVAHHRDREGAQELIEADLVVDATGRGSRLPAWLSALGYERVPEDGRKVDIGYASRHYRLRSDPFGTDHSIVSVADPMLPHGAIFTKTDSGKVELTVYGWLGDHPPTDPAGFNAFVKTLAAPEIYEAIIDAEPLNDPVLFRFPTTLWRRYDKMTRLPRGLLAMGDAVATPNPVFAQAQTLAALEAVKLGEYLRAGVVPDPLAYAKDVAAIIRPAWEMTSGVDLSFPGVPGERPLMLRLQQRYVRALHEAATRDSSITVAFMRAAGLMDPPQALMRPGLVVKVLTSWAKARAGLAA